LQTILSLAVLLLISALALVAPTDCGCPLDLHHGQALHPVFAHVHPDAPDASTSEVALLPLAQPQIRNSLEVGSAPQNALVGEVLPLLDWSLLTRSAQPLRTGSAPAPLGRGAEPPDPPPNRA
jgi:hypothetical protein